MITSRARASTGSTRYGSLGTPNIICKKFELKSRPLSG